MLLPGYMLAWILLHSPVSCHTNASKQAQLANVTSKSAANVCFHHVRLRTVTFLIIATAGIQDAQVLSFKTWLIQLFFVVLLMPVKVLTL